MKNNKFKLSKEQESAIDINRNMAVSAGAGSGKTRVLTSRFLKLLESGYEMDEIAAITFTEKAALEMKQRIRKAVITEISLSSGDEKAKWMSHLDKLSRANISTIHGFCSNIVKESAACLGVDFNFEIIDEIDKILKLMEAGEAAKEKLFIREEYVEFVEKLGCTYGENYIKSNFIGEVLNIRQKILDQGKCISELYNDSEDGSFEKFIYEMIKEIENYYSAYKLEKDLLDYNDLETMTLKILEDKKFRERYRKRYRTLLVDEFQDTNEIQRKIIYHIAADDNGNLVKAKLFIVGDFKQSIYGFRGSDHTIFKRVSKDIDQEGRVSLSTCYRSRNEIIKGVNSIFKELIKDYEPLKCPEDTESVEKRIKVITYNKEKESPGKLLTEVKNLLQGKSSEFESLEEAFQALKAAHSQLSMPRNKSGGATAKAIKLLHDKGLNFKDICVLVRSRNAIPEIEDELKKKNVPYCIIGGSGFYQRPEVDELLNLYKVTIRGFEGEFTYEDNLNFLKVMRGALFQIPDNLILDIRIQRDECKCKNLYEAMDYVIDGMEESENKARLQRVYETLKKLNMLKERLSVVQILNLIIKECRIYEIMLCHEDGIQRYRNIEKLMYLAKKFDSKELFTLDQFIVYIQLLMDNGRDDSEAALDTEDSEAVKIMTIHQSKGLEFSGIIVPKIQADLLWMSKNNKNQIVYYNDSIVLSKDLETGDEALEYQNYFTQTLSREVDESIRLLYVAMTRACNYVVLTGEDDGKLPEDFGTDEGKVKNLNSFLKQVKYALDVKNGDKSFIEFLNSDDLDELEAVNNVNNILKIDEENVDKKLKFRCNVKPSVMVSASGYMKYEKCPRKFYIENVLRVRSSDYLNTEAAEETAAENNSLNAASLGTVVHSIIEALNSVTNISEEEAINAAVEASGFNNIPDIRDNLKRYIDNYLLLEKEKHSLVDRVYLSNELEYNLTPHDDKKLSVVGFIDRLEVFKNKDEITAVITDYKTNMLYNETRQSELIQTYEPQLQLYGKAVKELLYYNGIKAGGIKLQIYFLDNAEKVEINYDEDKVQAQLEFMDSIFVRNLSQCVVNEFPKSNKNCDWCEYKDICME